MAPRSDNVPPITRLTLAFTTQPPGARATMHSMATRAVGQVAGVSKVTVKMASAGGPAAYHGPGGGV